MPEIGMYWYHVFSVPRGGAGESTRVKNEKMYRKRGNFVVWQMQFCFALLGNLNWDLIEQQGKGEIAKQKKAHRRKNYGAEKTPNK